ncbi:hypothetical protein HDV06_005272 [Boothiomyces sp. JEL0866]|nr:hypothetical protein HDV06_005272 [Boothiomyces sp. JEL0866]
MNQEYRLFTRLMYKNKNQFKHFIQYKKLEHVSRIYKKYFGEPKDELLLLGIKSLIQAYYWLKLLCKQTYFMPFTLSMMAICSRLMYYSKQEIKDTSNMDILETQNSNDMLEIQLVSYDLPEKVDSIQTTNSLTEIQEVEEYPDTYKDPINITATTSASTVVAEKNTKDRVSKKQKKPRKDLKMRDPALDFFSKKSEIDDIFGDL